MSVHFASRSVNQNQEFHLGTPKVTGAPEAGLSPMLPATQKPDWSIQHFFDSTVRKAPKLVKVVETPVNIGSNGVLGVMKSI